MLQIYKTFLLQSLARVQLINANPHGSYAECLSLQETLITKITYVERKIRQLRHHCRELKGRLRTADPAQRLTREQAALAKAELTSFGAAIDEYTWLLTIFREIGDW